jgi:hypothetical protein
MPRCATFGITLTSLALFLYAQQYQLQGTVKNQADYPVKNLVVKLIRAGHQVVTDTGGNFLISGSVGTMCDVGAMRASHFPQFRNNAFLISTPEQGMPLSVELFSAQGRRIGKVVRRRSTGLREQALPVDLHGTGASIVVADVSIGSTRYRFKLLRSGSVFYISDNDPYRTAAVRNRTAALPLDTLAFYRKDSIEYTIPITATSARYQVLLDLLPYEITEDVAIKEDRRGPEQVGSELRAQNIYPYDLWTYLTGPEDAWCSEFLCWAYRVAGYPVGTDEGTAARPRWLLKGNTNIRDWFQNAANKHEWIDRTSPKWETFIPVYGDFVRYDNSAGGHTGIVRYINGTTMYTVEGNVSNQVRLRTLTNYKSNTSIDGFGRRSGVRQDSHTQVF